jgi:hypothetical protein
MKEGVPDFDAINVVHDNGNVGSATKSTFAGRFSAKQCSVDTLFCSRIM